MAVHETFRLGGGGAKSTGGRWNSKGTPVVYAATSISLATLETLTRIDTTTRRNEFLVKITIPSALWRKRETVTAADLPPTWLAEPPGATSIDLGDKWLQSVSTALLLVPSVIVPEEYNVLINPVHRASAQITAEVVRQYIYDPRLKTCR
ncbi:RES domain-containing protein [Massilia sp. CCM 8734]|nr:RES domain-containing protein [Massilia sp. CCM 8734]